MNEPYKSTQQMFASPTKIESNDVDQFDMNWFDGNVFTDDLDNILSMPQTADQSCDIKDIISEICNGAEGASQTFVSPQRIARQSKGTTPKLSKCFEYMERLSPTKEPNSTKKDEMITLSKPMPVACSSKKTTPNMMRVGSVSKPKIKTRKKIRSGFKNSREITPVVEQRPLGFIDWLQKVSKTKPEQIEEIEFATPIERNAPEKSSTLSSPPLQPILIELMNGAATNDNQLTNSGESCLLYQLDPAALLNTTDGLESHAVVPAATQISPPTSENPAPPIAGSLQNETEFCDIATDDTNIPEQEATAPVEMKPEPDRVKSKVEKEKRKLENKAKGKYVRNEKRKLVVQQPQRQASINRRSFNIEVDDIFYGFEAVEPFARIQLPKRELLWLKSK